MKNIFTLILVLGASFSQSAAYDEDLSNYYVQGQDLNRGMAFINGFMCIVRNVVGKGELINDGKYNANVTSGLCSFDPRNQDDQNAGQIKSAAASATATQETAEIVSYVDVIADVKRASNTAPVTAQMWSSQNLGSTDPSKLPLNIMYDFSISKVPCSSTVTTNCSRFGNTSLSYSYVAAADNLETINPNFTGLNMTRGKTIGMGTIVTTDNSITYRAHQGAAGANLTLTSSADGNVVKGVYETLRSAMLPTLGVGYGNFAIQRKFYTDYSNDIHCEKFDKASTLIYKNAEYDFMTSEKRGPTVKSGFLAADMGSVAAVYNSANITDLTAYWTQYIIGTGQDFSEKCYSIEKTDAIKNVYRYGVYTQAGERFDLEQKAFPISATPSDSGAEFKQMNSYASEHGVYLEHRYRPYVTSSTEWRNSAHDATAAEKAKTYKLEQNFLRAEKRTTTYISLDDIHKQEIQFWFNDSNFNTEYKNLGFCGNDGKDKDDNNCTFVPEYIGYYDKDLNGLDGDSNTKGGFVFTATFACSGSGCTATTLAASDYKQFEISQWLATMKKTYGSYEDIRSMHFWNRDTHSSLDVRKQSLQNPSSNTEANGIRIVRHEQIPVSDLPATLHCFERCMDPTKVNTTYDALLTAAANIKANPATQSWECANGTNLNGASPNCASARSAAANPYADVGPYVKTSELNGSGALEFDWDNNGSVDYTWSNAAGYWMDGIRDSQKVTFTTSAGKIYCANNCSQNNTELTFNSTNSTKLSAAQDLYSYLSGARIQLADRTDNANWGLWMDNLVAPTELSNAQCVKTYNYANNTNSEYEYRAGWDSSEQQELRYCINQIREKVTTSYSVRLEANPRYVLTDAGTPVPFSSPKTLVLEIPETGTVAANYPASERGKKYRLHFQGFGQLHGIPGDVWNVDTGIKQGSFVNAWSGSFRHISRFIIPDGTLLTDPESNIQYKVKALNGEAYLLGKSISAVKSTLGVTDIPYDNDAVIAGTDVLKDLTTSTSADYIGAYPATSTLINTGNACAVDGNFVTSCIDNTN